MELRMMKPSVMSVIRTERCLTIPAVILRYLSSGDIGADLRFGVPEPLLQQPAGLVPHPMQSPLSRSLRLVVSKKLHGKDRPAPRGRTEVRRIPEHRLEGHLGLDLADQSLGNDCLDLPPAGIDVADDLP